MDKMLNLKSADGQVIQVPMSIKDMSVLIKDILQGREAKGWSRLADL